MDAMVTAHMVRLRLHCCHAGQVKDKLYSPWACSSWISVARKRCFGKNVIPSCNLTGDQLFNQLHPDAMLCAMVWATKDAAFFRMCVILEDCLWVRA